MLDELDHVFDDHPSLDASLEDFENNSNAHRSPLFGMPSQHSGFRSEESDGEEDPAEDRWSPPGLRQHDHVQGSGWYRHQPYLRQGNLHERLELKPTVGLSQSPSGSRDPSPQYEDASESPTKGKTDEDAESGDVTVAANVPLPMGPGTPQTGRSPSPQPLQKPGATRNSPNGPEDDGMGFGPENLSNYIRFAVRAEVQHREPIAAIFGYLRNKFDRITSSKSNTTLSVLILLVSIAFMRALLLPGLPQSIPDLVKLSGFARSFEPLIYYSENGVQQIGTLQETGVAVWDLSESVRGTNMTSAPIIVRQLDELSDSLKSLSLELTRFFANVDSDIDSILIVMDWAKRELETLSAQPPSSLPTIVFDNMHNMLSRLGALERTAEVEGGIATAATTTTLGHLVMAVLGPTSAQRTRATLTRTFTEFLSVLEESINSELTHSTALFALFESIDRQFLNLQRTVVRESDAQERAEGEMLSSLWTRVLGPDAAAVRKYEKNKKLLANVRSRTVANKHLLVDHRGRLLTLKVNLETLRRKLVSPLVRRNDSVSFMGVDGSAGSGSFGAAGRMLGPVEAVIDGQIKGLEGTYDYLRSVRERQKAKLMELVYGAGRKPSTSMLGLNGQEEEV
ncbi:uncharacterized protein N7477_009858 [Penicillium maclennaniae]|uniref:uncharacterized protein n=1 Tax=Penicillium maclennaniae TaxID=1343394 RepID=UPI002541DA28|nr:uncharacterized protein N7477_009858 [Penicillium maclennaniae]KAJ5662242.1 hypothetical protein N7477_009858 [Penicillium maclennaniae]